jgi:ketosteroid isomerase-like protein
MTSTADSVLAALEHATVEFTAGRVAAFQSLYSHSDEVTIFGAFGGHEHGWEVVGPRLAWAAAQFKPNDAATDRTVLNAYFGGDVGYVVTLESIPGSTLVDGAGQGTLRVTHVFRREGDEWRIVHRHADPLIDKAGAGGPPT